MMKQEKDQAATSRRNFLKLSTLGAAATGAAAVMPTGVAQASDQPAEGNRLYRETEHVKRVYDLARF